MLSIAKVYGSGVCPDVNIDIMKLIWFDDILWKFSLKIFISKILQPPPPEIEWWHP